MGGIETDALLFQAERMDGIRKRCLARDLKRWKDTMLPGLIVEVFGVKEDESLFLFKGKTRRSERNGCGIEDEFARTSSG